MALISDMLIQQKKAAEVMAEFLRRLSTEGIVPGVGACCDSIEVTTPEQSAFVSKTFGEVCDEMLPGTAAQLRADAKPPTS